jgi:fused signal recognition particle receptor
MSWFKRLKEGLGKSSAKLSGGITTLFTKRKLDDATLEELEELLITADLGTATAAKLTAHLAKNRFGKDISPDEVRQELAAQITDILAPLARPLHIDSARKPHIVLVVGVNGSGKTTTIGKLAAQYRQQGLRVALVAGDTFRAGAIQQLQIWGERTGCRVYSADAGSDAAALVFDAMQQSQAAGDDLLLIDTAGRLHNKDNLMQELEKIRRVIRRVDATAPHDCVLVLDATTGQAAHSQVEVFRSVTAITGLVVTKLDGTARGGVVVALAERFGLPVHAVGVGEQADDLQPFEAREFALNLVGIDYSQLKN